MLLQRPAVPALSYLLHVVLLVVAVALTACGGGGGGASPGLAPSASPPPVNPPSQFATGGKSFGAVSDRSLALPLYGISILFAAVVPPGSIFAGRRLETDNSISLTFESAAGAQRSVRFGATGVLPFIGTSGDVDYLEFGAIGTAPTLLNYSRFGALSFTSPTSQVVAFYGGFETPVGAGPTVGTMSYQGATLAAEDRAGTSYALAGLVHLEADFQSNRIFGSINNLKLFDDNGVAQGDYDYRFILSGVNVSNVGGSRTFNGALIAQKLSDGTTATNGNSIIDGRFFGNTAQEAAGVWQTDAIAGRDIWGSFAATTSTVSGTPTFLQSVGTPLTMVDQVTVQVDTTTGAGTNIASTAGTVTPLANDGLAFSIAALGTFDPPCTPGCSATSLDTSGAYVAGPNAVAVSGASATPSLLFLAERGTLSYARFGYWVDLALSTPNNIVNYTYFAAGVQTPALSMPSSGTATYAGTTIGKMIDNANTSFDFFGKVNLQANFGVSPTISGSVHSLTASPSAPPITSISLNSVAISGNQIMGGTTSAVGGLTGQWNGRFYGPGAEEVAGSYTIGGGTLQGWGSFGAGR